MLVSDTKRLQVKDNTTIQSNCAPMRSRNQGPSFSYPSTIGLVHLASFIAPKLQIASRQIMGMSHVLFFYPLTQGSLACISGHDSALIVLLVAASEYPLIQLV